MPLPADATSAVFVFLAGIGTGVLISLLVHAAAGLIDRGAQ